MKLNSIHRIFALFTFFAGISSLASAEIFGFSAIGYDDLDVVAGSQTVSTDPEEDDDEYIAISAEMVSWTGPGWYGYLAGAQTKELESGSFVASVQYYPWGCAIGWFSAQGEHKKQRLSDEEWVNVGSGSSYQDWEIEGCP